MNFQEKLDSLKEQERRLEEEVVANGGYIKDGKVYFEDKVYVIEIYTYERTEYESYGYTELHKNMFLLDDDTVNYIKDIKTRNDKLEMLDYLFNDIFDKYGEYMGECVEELDEKNVYIELDEEKTYITDDFLIEYGYRGENKAFDIYFSLFLIDTETFKKYKPINLKFSKTLTIN